VAWQLDGGFPLTPALSLKEGDGSRPRRYPGRRSFLPCPGLLSFAPSGLRSDGLGSHLKERTALTVKDGG